MLAKLRSAGFVGVPGPGERKCPRCKGVGRGRYETGPMDGCDRCAGTGVVALRARFKQGEAAP